MDDQLVGTVTDCDMDGGLDGSRHTTRVRRSIALIFPSLDLENQDWLIIALFLRLVKGKLWTRTSILMLWACRRRHKMRPHFCFRRMILVTTFRALVWSFVEPLAGFAADIILLARRSSSSSFLPALMPISVSMFLEMFDSRCSAHALFSAVADTLVQTIWSSPCFRLAQQFSGVSISSCICLALPGVCVF